MGWRKRMKGSGPFIGMVMVQLISTGLQILSKVILSQGTFIFALMAYRHLLAALCIAPFAFFLERGNWKKITLMVGFWVFLSSLTGITMGMGLFYYGLRDTTATYATNFLNLIPIVTFIFSILVRMEGLKLNTKRGKIRVIGTILCVAGALIISLYKGKSFHIIYHHNHHHHHKASMIINKTTSDWTRGTFLLVGCCFAYATWFLVQVKLLKAFPSKYWGTMLTCIGASIQTAIVGVCIDRRKSSWMLGWNLQLITILYSGVLASAASFCLISWAVTIKGPTYPPMFNPLSLIFIALIEALLLGEDLSIGSLVGMAVIIVGLYSFLWGSRGETKEEPTLPKSGSNRSRGRGVVLEGQTEVGVELGDPHFTATVVPTASPLSLTDDERPCLVTSF
uniref:WAT1-related protein n=1 Tax=Opuntia streptacantha TaxID=393608 RepID=A0A7C9EPA1_OPUST